ncbi:MAG TPA: SRPBCC family protein [Actinokineospora sp.]|nr:SRPBCC family protein [Actinokineospora sp.]
MSTQTTQVYKIYIKATPEAIWDAITKPEWTERYGYTGMIDVDLKPGGSLVIRSSEEMRRSAEANGYGVPELIIDGEVLEADAPRKLVTTWRMLMDPTMAEEGFTTLTHEIAELQGGYCSLTLIHDLTGAPGLAAMVAGGEADPNQGGGGWPWVLSDLKSLLETGKALAG